ncbi:hypothetical protein SISNIDRAFT_467183 [Sistotremastrum niveocremeum HHB9708]|uniref:BTB domain-containing protein n=1 Tax=Sistotremastrum niveocremeum HHB9708 TaxID=1314777 RepID=A0A164SZC6_9AGAM|nr:hypothetical protein SISNIDRAFT_467183 [Sistotremastrum niveocremeum HHB9708]
MSSHLEAIEAPADVAETLVDEPKKPRTSPQFNDADADLVCRTSDGVDFIVYQWLMAKASPLFHDLAPPTFHVADVNSIAGPGGGAIRVVGVDEDSKVFTQLLSFVYPVPNPQITTFDELSLLIDAAEKYNVSAAKEVLKLTMASDQWLKDAPLRVFSIARRYGYKEVVEQAFRHSLSVALATDSSVLDSPELVHLSLKDFQRLIYSKDRRTRAAVTTLRAKAQLPKSCLLCKAVGCAWHPSFLAYAEAALRACPTGEVLHAAFSKSVAVGEKPTLACPGKFESAMLAIYQDKWLDTVIASIDALPWVYTPPSVNHFIVIYLLLISVWT